jgi:hypothetical protein
MKPMRRRPPAARPTTFGPPPRRTTDAEARRHAELCDLQAERGLEAGEVRELLDLREASAGRAAERQWRTA